jgi:hypothetical protein
MIWPATAAGWPAPAPSWPAIYEELNHELHEPSRPDTIANKKFVFFVWFVASFSLSKRAWAVAPFVKALENKKSSEITLRLNSYSDFRLRKGPRKGLSGNPFAVRQKIGAESPVCPLRLKSGGNRHYV